jgi:hypothetical protein
LDFLPRCTGQNHACAFPRKAHALYQRHEVQQEIRGKPLKRFWSVQGTVVQSERSRSADPRWFLLANAFQVHFHQPFLLMVNKQYHAQSLNCLQISVLSQVRFYAVFEDEVNYLDEQKSSLRPDQI